MAHSHNWEALHEVYPPVPPAELSIVDSETGEPKSVPFERELVEGHVGYEHEEPYRTEYCGECGEKRVKKLNKEEAEQLGIRTGRITFDTLTNVGRNEDSA